VPPYSVEHDDLPINERNEALKFFQRGQDEIGVALEMDGWRSTTTCSSSGAAMRAGRSLLASSCSRRHHLTCSR
jgi:hypothetical protein